MDDKDKPQERANQPPPFTEREESSGPDVTPDNNWTIDIAAKWTTPPPEQPQTEKPKDD